MVTVTPEATVIGPAAIAFDRLGLSASKLASMPLTEQIQTIAEKIKMFGDSATRASYATQIFGKAGIDMLPFLMNGADALTQIREEMEKTGQL